MTKRSVRFASELTSVREIEEEDNLGDEMEIARQELGEEEMEEMKELDEMEEVEEVAAEGAEGAREVGWGIDEVATAEELDTIARGRRVVLRFPMHLSKDDREMIRGFAALPYETCGAYTATGFGLNKYHVAVDIAASIVAENGFKWRVSPKFFDKPKKTKGRPVKRHDPANKPECSIFSPFFFIYCSWWRDLPIYMDPSQVGSLENYMNLFVEWMRILYRDKNKMNNQYVNLVRYVAWRKQNNQDLALSSAFIMKQFVDYYAEFLKSNRAIINARTGKSQVAPSQASLHARAVFQVFQPLMNHQGYLEDGKSLIGTLACKTGMKTIRQDANERAKEDHQGATNCALDTATIVVDDEELFVDTLWRGELSTRSDADHIRCASMYITLSRWGARGQNVRLSGVNSLTMNMHMNKETPLECVAISSVQRLGKNCDASGSTRVKENTFHTIHASDIRYDALAAWSNHIVYHAEVEDGMFRKMEASLAAELADTPEKPQKWNQITPMFPTEKGKPFPYERHHAYMMTLFQLNPGRLHTKITHGPRYSALNALLASSAAHDAIANILKFQHATTMNSVYAKGAMGGSELFILNMWLHEAEYAPWWFHGTLDKHDIPDVLWNAIAPQFDRIHELAKQLQEQGKDHQNALKAANVLRYIKIVFLEATVWLRPEFPDRVMYSGLEIFRDPKLLAEWNAFALRHAIRSLATKYMLREKYPGISVREWSLPTDCIPQNRRHPVFRMREERQRTINIFPKIEKLCATCGVGVDYFIHLTKEMGHADILKHVVPSTLMRAPKTTPAAATATTATATPAVAAADTAAGKRTAIARLTPFPEHFESIRHAWDLWIGKYKRMYADVQTARGIPWKAIGNEGMKQQYHATIDFLKYTENELQVFRTDLPIADRTDLYFKTLDTFRVQASNVTPVSFIRQHFYYTVHTCKIDSKDYKQMQSRGCTPEQLRELFRKAGLTVPEIRETRGNGKKARATTEEAA